MRILHFTPHPKGSGKGHLLRRGGGILLLLALALSASARSRENFDEGWRFTLGDSIQMSQSGYDDSSWRLLDLPHDWAIEGDFSDSNPSGAGGGALPGGVG